MNKVNAFLKLVESRGIKYSLKARLESIGTNRAEVHLQNVPDHFLMTH